MYSMTDVPLGFGTSAKSTNDARAMDPGGIVVFHQVPPPPCPARPPAKRRWSARTSTAGSTADMRWALLP